MKYQFPVASALLLLIVTASSGHCQIAAPLPTGVQAVWDFSKAHHETTSTRDKTCLNGLWRWQPAETNMPLVPKENWGYFKVPGCWPGITDYMQKDSQSVYAHPKWQNIRLGQITSAWYERQITISPEWRDRRILLSLEYLNSLAVVFVDGEKQGEIRFPGGELDLTASCRPGQSHTLSLHVVALPLKDVLVSYKDSNVPSAATGKVGRRGLCGDVYLIAAPAGPRINDVKIDTSFQQSQITLNLALSGLSSDAGYALRAEVSNNGRLVKDFASRLFRSADLINGRVSFVEPWKADALWDLHTPENQLTLTASLVSSDGRELDRFFPVRFGYRELWIKGRDFYLNGSRVFLSAVPLDNAQVGAALANYQSARESLERLKSIGINFVYTHNYGCEPGSHLGFEEILRAADDVGMLVALSQPHFSHYDWRAPDADRSNGYARHAEYYVRIAQNHPSVIAYAMSHNAAGYNEDMNPDMIDGFDRPRDQWSERNSRLALRCESMVKQLDPSRIVYHHAGGNLGSMHTSNFYPNFAPIQELSDWFEHWATEGVKPMFTCEYGAPFTWDWTMYRGWYKGQREFGSATVPWEFCLAEWNAQFLGDRAFQISQREAANLRWEAQQFRAGKLWHRWDYPSAVGSPEFDERFPIFARYLRDNWPAFRTWGVSAISPWEYGHFWKLRKDIDRRRKNIAVDWQNLQRPGFSPDYIEQQYERYDLAFERSDWVPTEAARTLIRYNQPLLAYISGKASRFTSKDHLFVGGETVEKQIVVINNSRQTLSAECEWSWNGSSSPAQHKSLTIPTGEQERVQIRIPLAENLAVGSYELTARVRFSNGVTQSDSFTIDVIPRTRLPRIQTQVALFDPKGETGDLLTRLQIPFRRVAANDDLSSFTLLVIGKGALTTNSPAPDVRGVRTGLKVVMFEQTADVLEKRLGFRIAEYGLRQVFARVPDHPALAGLGTEELRDWRGEATLVSPRLEYELRPRHGPSVTWCGIQVPRLWRCGNRGNVASVLIEKPARGDFLPILDGGYNLQYTPLLEFREGRGLILFCQLDVTGRTEIDPAAETFAARVLEYASDWKPAPVKSAFYAGDPVGQRHFESAGFHLKAYTGEKLEPDNVLVLGPGGLSGLASAKFAIEDWLRRGGRVLAVGVGSAEAALNRDVDVRFSNAEHIATHFEPPAVTSVFRGISPADVHNRDPRELPLIKSGATILGDGVLAAAQNEAVVFCQLIPWQFDPSKQSNLKRTFRRVAFTTSRLLANLGVPSTTPLLDRIGKPLESANSEQRWLDGFYLDQPEEWDDPYRFFRW